MTLNLRRTRAVLTLGMIALWCGPMTAAGAETPANKNHSVLETHQPAAADFDALRLRWRDLLDGGPDLDIADPNVRKRLRALSSHARTVWKSMDKSPNRTCLWNDLSGMTTNSSQIGSTYGRLDTMALAYATRGTRLSGNRRLLADLVAALDWMNANVYNKSTREYDNWWHWEIGVPLDLEDITVLLYDRLTPAQITNYMDAVNHFTPSVNGTGANLVWKATVVAVRGVIVKNSSEISSAIASLSSLFPYVTKGDGFYVDGSFVQHGKFPYNGGYGVSLLKKLASLLYLTDGSPWECKDPNQQHVFRWVRASFEPLIYRGAMMDMVRGREISRQSSSDHAVGDAVMTAMLRLAQIAPPADATNFQRMVKFWVEEDTARNYLRDAPLSLIPRIKQILADPNLPPARPLIGHYQFAAMDRVVHRRPGFAFGVSMSSSRIGTYECINRENLHGWYTGDGMTYLYNSDLTAYDDFFWPTVNPYRMPGTTVDTQHRSDGSGEGYRPHTTWVGGVTLGDYGTAGMELHAWNSPLVAKKSWFMFDDEIVCLGSGITCTDGHRIETIVEDRKLNSRGNNSFLVNGISQPTSLGWSTVLTNAAWACLTGKDPNSDIGWFFPQRTSLNASREARTGSWYDLNHYGLQSARTQTRNYLALWFNHGANPVNATYAYVILPDKTPAQTGAYAARPDVQVLENSSTVQAVREKTLGITAANFWKDGDQTADGITVDRKAAVIFQISSNQLAVAVSDPTQTNETGISLTIHHPVSAVARLDSGVTVKALTPVLQLVIHTAKAEGKSFHATFSLQK